MKEQAQAQAKRFKKLADWKKRVWRRDPKAETISESFDFSRCSMKLSNGKIVKFKFM